MLINLIVGWGEVRTPTELMIIEIYWAFSVMASTIPLIGLVQGEWGFNRLFMILGIAALFIFIFVLFLPKQANALQH